MAWQDDLQPGSYRGAPFYIDAHDYQSGRRLAVHEFPGRDDPAVDDLGRRARKYRVRAYVLADPISGEYFAARDALHQALEAAGPGTLVHPYLGTIRVFCETVAIAETAERGGEAAFDIEFVTAGVPPSPLAVPDTASALLGGIGSFLSLAVSAYAIGSLIAQRPGILLGIAAADLSSLATGLLGLGPTVVPAIAGLAATLAASASAPATPVTSTITGVTGDPVAVAVTDIFVSAAQAVLAAAPVPAADDPVLGQPSSLTLTPADPSGGVAAFAAWMPPSTPAGGLQATAQASLTQQLTDLVQGAATAAVAQIYAGTQFATGNAATAARTQLLGMISAQTMAAAAAGQDAVFSGWLGLTGLAVADLTQRVQNLPLLTTYSTRLPLPAPVLAQLLYQDGSRGAELAALNGAIHPGFMPVNGLALTQ